MTLPRPTWNGEGFFWCLFWFFFGWILVNYHNTALSLKVRTHGLELSSSPQRPFCSKSQTCAGLPQCCPLIIVVHGTQHCGKSALFALSWCVCLFIFASFCCFLNCESTVKPQIITQKNKLKINTPSSAVILKVEVWSLVSAASPVWQRLQTQCYTGFEHKIVVWSTICC